MFSESNNKILLINSSDELSKEIKSIDSKHRNRLESVLYSDDVIKFDDIHVFKEKNRSKNDCNNKKRENIIACIINKKIPEEYYTSSLCWNNLKNSIFSYIEELCKNKDINCINTIKCIQKAGRGHHYDFKLIIKWK